ncbi:MAG: hypothetical protein ACI8PB_000418 [Desulforhopalus sp.]|jgi:hypothetical protein
MVRLPPLVRSVKTFLSFGKNIRPLVMRGHVSLGKESSVAKTGLDKNKVHNYLK